MSPLRELAYRLDPALWMREVLQIQPAPWQESFLRASLGASVATLTARQAGKTTTAAITHHMLHTPSSLSVVACPAQTQSKEAVRRVREFSQRAGAELVADNVYGLELKNGARVLALPGSDDSVRGLTVDGWIVVDEAARVSHDLIAALRPMRARRPQARLAMLSTAWSRSDPFWSVWASDDPSWLRLKATADSDLMPYDPAFLEQERRQLGEEAFKREYRGVPSGGGASLFTWALFERAMTRRTPLVAAGTGVLPAGGAACGANAESIPTAQDIRRTTMTFHRDQPTTWPAFWPLIIAHDVGRSRDRSTAVIGGNSSFQPRLIGIRDLRELPRNLYGSPRASALAAVDREYNNNALIVADLSNDPTYGGTKPLGRA